MWRHVGAFRLTELLVVEDCEDTRTIYATYLRHAGFCVYEASDGAQALALLAKTAVRGVILDLAIPVVSGLEVMRAIKGKRSREKPFVLIVTGDPSVGAHRGAWAAGADDLCEKPCLPEEVLGRVRRLLRATEPAR
jgi:DNA-binding response OmpR family regulator